MLLSLGGGTLLILVLFGAMWAITYAPPPPSRPFATPTHTSTAMSTPRPSLAVTPTDWRSQEVIAATELARGLRNILIESPFCNTRRITTAEQIAFTTYLDGQVMLIISEAGNARNACQVMMLNSATNTLSWSPDGTHIAVNDGGRIGIVEISTGILQTLAQNAIAGSYVSWSPDGTQLAYTASSITGQDIIILKVVDSTSLALTASTSAIYSIHTNPAWSPDGTEMAFVAYTNTSTTDGFVHVINISTGDTRIIYAGRKNATSEIVPSWSPDGATLIFLSVVNDDVHLVNVQSNAESFQLVAVEQLEVRNVQWTASNTITYQSNRERTPSVFEIDGVGNRLRWLTPGAIVQAYDYWRES